MAHPMKSTENRNVFYIPRLGCVCEFEQNIFCFPARPMFMYTRTNSDYHSWLVRLTPMREETAPPSQTSVSKPEIYVGGYMCKGNCLFNVLKAFKIWICIFESSIFITLTWDVPFTVSSRSRDISAILYWLVFLKQNRINQTHSIHSKTQINMQPPLHGAYSKSNTDYNQQAPLER